MNSALASTIQTLLPAMSIVPPDLTRHAARLLAQSRHLVQLPAKHEHCRAHICAHLACVRLQSVLSLDKAMPHQLPCSEKQYRALFDLFDAKLPDESASVARPAFSSEPTALESASTADPLEQLPDNDLLKTADSNNLSTLSRASIAGVSASLGLPQSLVPLARSGVANLFTTNPSAGPSSQILNTARPFGVPPRCPAYKCAEMEWAVFGAVLFVLLYGDVVERVGVVDNDNDTTTTTKKQSPTKRKLHAFLRKSPDHDRFCAKFLKLARAATDEHALDHAIQELQLICFARDMRTYNNSHAVSGTAKPSSSSAAAAAKVRYSVLNKRFADGVRRWVARAREIAASKKGASAPSSTTEEIREAVVSGSMIRPSVMFLTRKRKAEFETWNAAILRKLKKIEQNSTFEPTVHTRSAARVH
ncbi:origin recognition complex subunit 6-domain-containing protein [Myxozyma melibiosi]|uniref:Origin recognition complex subunit 6-domain-containing protein n=1 Tax=Myxozyma melibiosi TaxID=54550 RepID=A0ABR1FCK3_9ASCO